MKKKVNVSSLIKGIAVIYCLFGFVLFIICIAISTNHDFALYNNFESAISFYNYGTLKIASIICQMIVILFRTSLIYGFGVIVNMAEEYLDNHKRTNDKTI